MVAPDNRGWENSFGAWEDNDESAWTWRGDLTATAPFETRLVFARTSERDYQMLLLKSDGKQITAQFWRAQSGKLSRVGQDGALNLGAAKGQLALQHTSARTRALWNGAVVAQMWGEVSEGQWGVATRGAKIENARLQPLEAVSFSDDFMRAESPDAAENPGQWTRVSGVWKTSGLLGQRADAALNPNPFVFRASLSDEPKTQTALTTAGQWFWSDYAVAAAVKPMLHDAKAPLIAALNAYVQKDGTRISGEIDFRSGRAIIKRGAKVLGTSAAFEVDPDQWHRVYLDPGPGTMRLLVDGVERVRVDGETGAGALAQGPLALSALTGSANAVDFDDVRAVPTDATSDQFQRAIVGRWDDWQGVWQTQAAAKNGRRVALSAGSALTLTGGSEREEGLVEATFALSDKAAEPAVVFAARDKQNFTAARLRAGNLEIVEMNDGKARLLSATPATFGATPKIEVEWRDGIITARAGNATTTATVAAVPAGRIGAWSLGAAKSVALTSFRALGAAPAWGEGALPERFAKDTLMKNWASNAAAWKRGSDGTWWHTGDFFGDSALTLPLPKLPAGGTLTLRLAANPANKDSGAQVKIAHIGTNWQWTLLQNGKTLETQTLADADWKDEERTVRFVRRPLDAERALLRVAANGRVLLSQTAQSKSDGIKSGVTWGGTIPTPPKGNVMKIELTTAEREKRAFVGVRLVEITPSLQKDLDYDGKGTLIQGVEAESPALAAGLHDNDVVQSVDGEVVASAQQMIEAVQAKKPGDKVALQIWRPNAAQSVVDWENTLATTTQSLDYTFTSAPVDWQATQGRWEVAERWTCSPQWAFFVGSNAVNPTLWSRFGTRDDWSLEAYIATPMDLTRGERSPIDLNLTVGGDGRDLASGYSFVFGGENRTANRIYRGDKIVFDKPFEMPAGSDNTHQDWFYVRLERRRTPQGLNFRYSVNNHVVMEFTDPQPLDAGKNGGRFAFWTYNGGLSIARARLWYQNLTPATAPLLTAQNSEIVPVVTPVKNALDEWAPRRDDVLKISSRVQEISDAGKNGVKIVNPQSGGDWTTYVSRRAYDVKARPFLNFDYRIGTDALVNLYVKIDNRWREIGFTGNGVIAPATKTDDLDDAALAPFDDAPNRPAITAGFAPLPAAPVDSSVVLGQIAEVKADKQWHHARFDLLSALRRANLGTTVQEIAFAAPSHDYIMCGLGGNHLGASFEIANFDGDKAGVAGAQMAAR